MPVPSLTAEQRAAALAKAAAARKDRSELRAKLRSGKLGLAELLDSSAASRDATVTKMRVSALLEALPGVGKTRAAQIMERLDIAANRRVGGLGVHQRRALVAEFERRANAQRARTYSRASRMGASAEPGT
ncbi:MAG: integration host factor, actinobacterial type [Geodermatophilaceae bacterium]